VQQRNPFRRVVQTSHGEMVAEVTNRSVVMRPLRARKGGKAEIAMSWGQLYQHAIVARIEAQLREKRRLARERKRNRGRK
jgi:hypothetical protein